MGTTEPALMLSDSTAAIAMLQHEHAESPCQACGIKYFFIKSHLAEWQHQASMGVYLSPACRSIDQVYGLTSLQVTHIIVAPSMIVYWLLALSSSPIFVLLTISFSYYG